MTSDAELLKPWQSMGGPPPTGGTGPICPECGKSVWIELGGGSAQDVYHPNLDIQDNLPGVDMLWDLESGKIPFHDGHAQRIKTIHVLNHLSFAAGEKVLTECFRVLQSPGNLFIMVTDLEFVCDRVLKDGPRNPWVSSIFGSMGDGHEADFHKSGYTAKSLCSKLLSVGFSRAEFLRFYNRWEFCMEAIK